MKDPAFLFYPGDYLRDTQTMSSNAQVAYDRIMCEHMRNICITQQQLKFFTKRLSQDEKDELMYVLSEVDGGFQITWVAESICKRREYSESRRQNRLKKTSKTYDEHMENENEDVIEDKGKGGVGEKPKKPRKVFVAPNLEELSEYMAEYVKNKNWDSDNRRIKIEAERFINHYTANGWMAGKNKMKDWQASARNWLTNCNFSQRNAAKPQRLFQI